MTGNGAQFVQNFSWQIVNSQPTGTVQHFLDTKMSLTLVGSLSLGLPKRIRSSGGTGFPPPIFWTLPLPKQVAEVQPLLLVLTLVHPSWVSLKPNLPLLHALHLAIRLLGKFKKKLKYNV